MKGKLFIFGIGGTGSRVLKSLVMLASAGVDIEADAIVPIVVDPDFANADLTRTIEQFRRYSSLRDKLSFDSSVKNGFFKIPIEDVVNGYRLQLKDTKNKKFKEFIQFDTLSKTNQALAAMLFSRDNLESNMEVGFKGNPNIGSVVLNQFTDSDDFIEFAAAFKPGDRIFIVSSIFGGTGASGFPVLLKNLRSIDPNLPNCDAISNAPIGAITVLPYFDVTPDPDSAIDSSTFIGKTKAALHYYENNVTGDESSINALYYIGDNRKKQYDNEEGGQTQQNNAHIVELASALAIANFTHIDDTDSSMICQPNSDGRIYAPYAVFKEFGIENNVPKAIFGDLARETRDTLELSLTQFVLFSKFIDNHLKQSIKLPWAVDNEIDSAFIKTAFIDDVRAITSSYLTWLDELSNNDRGFEPFNLSVSDSDIFDIVNGVKPSKIGSLKAFLKSGMDLFDTYLDSEYGNLPKNYSKEQKFVELFYLVTKELVEKKFKF